VVEIVTPNIKAFKKFIFDVAKNREEDYQDVMTMKIIHDKEDKSKFGNCYHTLYSSDENLTFWITFLRPFSLLPVSRNERNRPLAARSIHANLESAGRLCTNKRHDGRVCRRGIFT